MSLKGKFDEIKVIFSPVSLPNLLPQSEHSTTHDFEHLDLTPQK
jgi:hypothetical protein